MEFSKLNGYDVKDLKARNDIQELKEKTDTTNDELSLLNEENRNLNDSLTLLNEKIQSETDTRISTNTDLQAQIDSLTNGTPLVASSISEMTDTSRIYVNTTNGEWYYHNGSEWVSGGLYQSTGIEDGSITPEKTTFINVNKSINIFNKNDINVGGYLNGSGNVIGETNTTYGYSNLFKCNGGDSVKCFYNSNLVSFPGVYFLSDGTTGNMKSLSNYTIDSVNHYFSCTLPDNCIGFKVNIYTPNLHLYMVIVNEDYPSDYVEYYKNYSLSNEININAEFNSVLSNKKWIVCGDSISYGHSADLDENGVRKTYDYYISKRNNMNIVKNAISGSTMMNVAGKNPFSVNRYQNLGNLDADYITLAFGANDSAQSTDLIGSITDTTNDTFYGAWNIVLSHLITTYPKAKIGIIGFWRGNDKYQYTDAIREIAKKYQIPFLDFMGDRNVPLIGGTDFRNYNPNLEGPPIDWNTLQSRINTFLTDTVHPNDDGYKYMSTIIENWLKSL